MSDKNFMAYGDAEAIFTGYANRIKKSPTTFIGTTAEWNALSAVEKAVYKLVNLTDDVDKNCVVDRVEDGNMNAVTSNAVADELAENIQTLRDAEVVTGKNLLPNNALSQTINGVTFTHRPDGSVLVNGTATALTSYILVNGRDSYHRYKLPDGKYIVSSGQPYNAATKFVFVSLMKNAAYVHQDIGTTKSEAASVFTISNEDYDAIHMGISISNGTTVENMIFYPMLRKASEEDGTYEPYHEEVKDAMFRREEQRVLGAKNLVKPLITSGTMNDLTYVVNDDGTITVNGTASAASAITINGKLLDVLDPNQSYIYSGAPKTSSESTYFLYLGYNPGNGSFDHEFGDGVRFCLSDKNVEYTNVNLFIFVREGAILNNVVFKPMIRLASDPDDTYVPYAMANKELTDLNTTEYGSTNLTGVKWARYGKIVFLSVNGYTGTGSPETVTGVPEPISTTVGGYGLSFLCKSGSFTETEGIIEIQNAVKVKATSGKQAYGSITYICK